jgi:hypothetical protein
MTARPDTSRLSKRFVLPYESEYTAHRKDERASRVTQLRLRAREHVRGRDLTPDRLDTDCLVARRKRMRFDD